MTGQIEKIDSKIDALIARLSELPKNIPAKTLYQEIERLQKEKTNYEEKSITIVQSRGTREEPITPVDYKAFLVRLMKLVKGNPSFETKKAIVEALLHRVEIHESGFRLGFYVGTGQIKKGEALASPSFLKDNIFSSTGSFLLQNGRPRGTWSSQKFASSPLFRVHPEPDCTKCSHTFRPSWPQSSPGAGAVR